MIRFSGVKDNIRQYGTVRVVVGVKTMLGIVIQHDTTHGLSIESLKEALKTSGEFFMFRSGAKLCSVDGKKFYIKGYASDGADISAAMAELRMLDALREAKRHCNRMMVLNQSYRVLDGKKRYPELRVDASTFTYPTKSGYGNV